MARPRAWSPRSDAQHELLSVGPFVPGGNGAEPAGRLVGHQQVPAGRHDCENNWCPELSFRAPRDTDRETDDGQRRARGEDPGSAKGLAAGLHRPADLLMAGRRADSLAKPSY